MRGHLFLPFCPLSLKVHDTSCVLHCDICLFLLHKIHFLLAIWAVVLVCRETCVRCSWGGVSKMIASPSVRRALAASCSLPTTNHREAHAQLKKCEQNKAVMQGSFISPPSNRLSSSLRCTNIFFPSHPLPRPHAARPQDWILDLLTLQTSERWR